MARSFQSTFPVDQGVVMQSLGLNHAGKKGKGGEVRGGGGGGGGGVWCIDTRYWVAGMPHGFCFAAPV